MSEQQPDISSLIDAALSEDGCHGDITSQLIIPADKQGEIRFVARQELVACGTFVPGEVYAKLDTGVKCVAKVSEGAHVKENTLLAVARGPAQALLAGERVALNIMQRMSGVATLTALYVEAVTGTDAVLLDTRKTMPGMRQLDKYAVRVGGGQNHRMGLDDMVLIKDNHIALSGSMKAAIETARAGTKLTIVVECDRLEQVQEALAAKPDRILLDNMNNDMLKKAVAMSAGKIPLEASGGVSLETIREIAETGVDFISVGKLTHSAPAVNIAADVEL